MKVYWFAYKQLIFINLSISSVLSLGSPNLFPITFASFGYICTLLLYQYFYRQVWFVYLNIGYSKSKIILGTFLINLIPSIALSPTIWLLK